MEGMEKVYAVAKILDEKKADNIKAVRIKDLTVIADYFVIAGATSSTQVRALADEVEFKMSQQGIEPLRVEGHPSSGWTILDYGDVVVHVFYKDTRNFYDLERLWADGTEIPLTFAD